MDSHGPALKTREDLEVFERDSEKERCFLIKDPVLRTYHRLGSLAYAVLEALEQGGQAGAPLRESLRREHGIDVPEADLERVVEQLAKLSLFEVTPQQALLHGEPPERVAQLGALQAADPSAFLALQAALLRRWEPRPSWTQRVRRMRLSLYDPHVLLGRLEPLGRFLFRGQTAVATGVLAVFALVLMLGNGDELGRDLARIANHPFLFIIVMLAVATLHELGHGLACRVYGGEVHDMGLMLLYLVIPSAYCDVSDAYLIESRRRRAVVALAGCYVNVLLWIGAMFVWRLFEPELLPTQIALCIIATTSLSLFFNLNPLLPLDGYYAVSELLGVENLRTRSDRPGVYRAYRWLASGYLVLLVPPVLIRLFSFLVGRFRLLGFICFVSMTFILLQPLGRKLWRLGFATPQH